MFSSLGEKAKKYPRQLSARGYFRIKKEGKLTAAGTAGSAAATSTTDGFFGTY